MSNKNTPAPPAKKRRVTIIDIAAEAGVSHSAVSYALNGKAEKTRIGKECVQRILEAAQRLGYRRNAAAKAICTGRFNAVALVLPSARERTHLPPMLQMGIHDALAAAGRHLIVAYLPDERLTDTQHATKILTEMMCDGMILNYHLAIPQALESLLDQYSVPAVWQNVKRPWNCVYPDDAEAGRLMATRALELGHRRFAYVDAGFEEGRATDTLHYSQQDRLAGVESALRGAGLSCERIFDNPAPPRHAARNELLLRLADRLRAPDRPTALLTNTVLEADLAMRAAALARVDVGRGLGIATVVSEGEQHAGYPVASAVLPEYDMGRRVAEMILTRIESPDRNIKSARVAPYFQEGETLKENGVSDPSRGACDTTCLT